MAAPLDRGIRPLLVPPRLRTLEQGDGRRASYLELFFDLAFVVAIAHTGQRLLVVLELQPALLQLRAPA